MITKFVNGIIGFTFVIIICRQSFATEVVPCKDGEANCWQCGETCYTRFDSSSHTITFSGNGEMYSNLAGDSSEAPWRNISSKIYSVVIEEGITTVSRQLFHNFYQNTSNIKSISLPTTLTSIGGAAFARLWNGNQLDGLVIPENVKLNGSVFYYSKGNFYCPKSQIEECNQNNPGNTTKISSYEKIDGMYYIYDNEGKLSELYDSYTDFSSSVKKPINERLSQKDEAGNISVLDENGQVIAKYSANGVLTKFAYYDDGSIGVYKDGKLVGLKNAKYITPAQAAELVKPGKNNIVTLTFK